MDINSTKLELFDWLLHIKDEKLLKKILSLKKVEEKQPDQPVFGRLKGQIKIADDFDEPLEGFKEYMP
ncbi:MAG TPA: DUF2281 domain-containing protein [Bacteroidia bacterium]|nr:DUF2281 domain-containing protein [Bacteroidia bacterium]